MFLNTLFCLNRTSKSSEYETCKACLPKCVLKRKQDNGKNNIMISEGGARAFQSNSAVNGLVQNSCIRKAKPQHLKPTPCFSTDNDGHLG